jgi:Acetyltransferase (isoleucine patch superfamily)
LIVGDIRIEDGAWIGARAVVCPGVTVGTHAVLSVGSVARTDLTGFRIFSGNPATERRIRHMKAS